jgi:single-strand DNA-binding protein
MFLNKVILIGRLTHEPDHRYTPSGISVCNLRLAVPRRYNTPSGEKREETLFINVEAWQKQADICSRFLRKGRRVLIEGRLVTDTWVSTGGERRSKIKVVAQNVRFMDKITEEPAPTTYPQQEQFEEQFEEPSTEYDESFEEPPEQEGQGF